MAILEILHFPDPRLRERTEPVTGFGPDLLLGGDRIRLDRVAQHEDIELVQPAGRRQRLPFDQEPRGA